MNTYQIFFINSAKTILIITQTHVLVVTWAWQQHFMIFVTCYHIYHTKLVLEQGAVVTFHYNFLMLSQLFCTIGSFMKMIMSTVMIWSQTPFLAKKKRTHFCTWTTWVLWCYPYTVVPCMNKLVANNKERNVDLDAKTNLSITYCKR